MRLGARLLASLLLVSLYLPLAVTVASASTETIGITTLSSTETAGVEDTNVVVTAFADGIPDPTYTGTVTFTSSDPGALLPDPYTFNGADAGVHTFSVTFTHAGSRSLTVTDDGSLTDTAFSTVSATTAATISVAGGGNLAAGDSRDITATVKDTYGNPVIGQSVTFSKSAGSGSVSGLGDADTDGSGVATDTVTGDGAGSITIEGTTADAGSDSVTFSVTSGTATGLAVTQDTSDLTSGDTKSVTATVTDDHGNPVPGESVVFTKAAGGGTLGGLTTVVTDGSGVATDVVTGLLAGSVTVTATDGALHDSVTFTVVAGDAAALNLTGSTASLASDATRTLTATVTDAHGNAVSGESVVFTKTGAGTGTVSGLGGGTSPTNASGVATDDVTALLAGSITITATDGGLTDTLTFTITAGAATTLTVSGSTGNLASSTARTVTATLTDAEGNGVSGQTIAFTQSGAGTVSGLTSPVTNASGVVTDIVTGVMAGSVTVTATHGSLHDALDFTVVAGTPTALNLTGSATNLASGTGRTVTATVTDAHGNPASGESVVFSKTGAGTGTVTGLGGGPHPPTRPVSRLISSPASWRARSRSQQRTAASPIRSPSQSSRVRPPPST